MKKNLTNMLSVGILLTLGGCASNYNSTGAKFNQLTTAHRQVIEMQNKPKQYEQNLTKYTFEDLTNAYAVGCMNFPNGEEMSFEGLGFNDSDFISNFTATVNGYSVSNPQVLDNVMFCKAAKDVVNNVKYQQMKDNITEPISAAIWLSFLNGSDSIKATRTETTGKNGVGSGAGGSTITDSLGDVIKATGGGGN